MDGHPGIAIGGFMGAGKSSVGAVVAARLGLPFVDTDELLTDRWGPIPEQFRSEGEAVFRAREREVVLSLCDGRPRVVATGGGVWPDPALRAALGACYRTVVLTASLEVIRSRIQGDASRPLSGIMERLFVERAEAYQLAELVVDTGERALAVVVEEVVEWARGS